MALTNLSELKFFQTAAHPCGYLEGEDASNVFVDPEAKLDLEAYAQLTEFGFRRSGEHLYRPNCAQCKACMPIRIPVQEFKFSKNQRRCLNKNKDLSREVTRSIDNDECFALFERYINIRHRDGDMYPASRDTFDSFLCPAWGSTQYVLLRNAKDQLLSVAVTDRVRSELSAIYSFFEPEEESRSLGVYNVLHQIEWAQQLNCRYLYLGYWISECAKMNYKTRYKPYELLLNRQWVRFES